jgi:Family of unknown function (DUF6267)
MSKNTHLEHLEDSILFDGEQGAKDAFAFLDELTKTFSGNQTSRFKITTKWDGAPAIICGIDPEFKRFFVGTKSVFNKDGKINYTEDDIEANHGHAPGLVEKLEVALKYFPKLNIKGIVQGDLLFTDDGKDAKIDGKDYFTFTPNTITYAIPKGTPAYDKAKKAKIGVVFHTRYVGSSIATSNATFGVDISKFTNDDDIFVISAEVDTLGSNVLLNAAEERTLKNMNNVAQRTLPGCKNFLNDISVLIEANDLLTVGPRLKTYFNTYVREGRKVSNVPAFINNFKKYFEGVVMKEVDKAKMAKTKAAKLKKLYDGMELVDNNIAAFKKLVVLYNTINNAKLFFVKKLSSADATRTFLRTEHGFKVTAPEGFVAIKDGAATKLVDRLEFSVANFTIDKNWVKGD